MKRLYVFSGDEREMMFVNTCVVLVVSALNKNNPVADDILERSSKAVETAVEHGIFSWAMMNGVGAKLGKLAHQINIDKGIIK